MRTFMRAAVSAGLVGLAGVARAAGANVDDRNARTVSVSGEAEVKVVPDEVVVTLGIESSAKKLADARKDNDERVKAVFAVVRANGVDDKHVQTDHISIEPHYPDYGSSRTLEYVVRKTVVITLRELSRFEGLLGAALDAGANYVHGVDFQTTRLREHRDHARAQAVKAATEKATALARELGMKVGRPRSISEGGGGWWSSYGWWGGRSSSMSQNVSQNAGGGAAASGATVAPGTISVTASVSVTFDLE